MRVLVINGSYRKAGVIDHYCEVIRHALVARGADVDCVTLRDADIEFCTNCRVCMQQPGVAPGPCIFHDAMDDIVARIEASDAFVLASPTNAGSVTALFKRMIERLVVYGYWPWGKAMPALRKAKEPKKKAILLSACAAPGFLGRLAFVSLKQMKAMAKMIGAQTCGTYFGGFHGQQEAAQLTPKQIRRVERLVEKLF